MTQRVGNPFAPFLDLRGLPLTGTLYLGTEGDVPETSPVDAFFDPALTIAAPQPITVVGGFVRNSGNPALLYVAEDTFSMRTRDEDGGQAEGGGIETGPGPGRALVVEQDGDGGHGATARVRRVASQRSAAKIRAINRASHGRRSSGG